MRQDISHPGRFSTSISHLASMNSHLPSSILHPPSKKETLPLRIGILMDHPSPHMVSLLDALGEREDCGAMVVYCGQSAPERGWGAPEGSLPFHFLKGLTISGGFRINFGLIETLTRAQVDVWIVNTVYSSPSTLLAALWLGYSKIPWIYMNEPPRPRNKLASTLKSFPLEAVLRRASGVIGMGERAASIYRELLSDDKPVSSIPYYVNLNEFLGLPVSTLPTNGKPLNFVVCCQMIHRKGLDILLRACQQVKDINWRLTLVGDGPLRPALEREFRVRFTHDRVIFRGGIPYEKRHEAFADHHVFLFPSRWDGWGMVLPEALAAGLPVVATDQVISAHEFIKNGINGFIIPAEDPVVLAERMIYFLRQPEAIPSMSLAARKALENYRPEVGAERLVQFLSNLVNSNQMFSRISRMTTSPTNNPPNWKQLVEPTIWHRRWKSNFRGIGRSIIINGRLALNQRKKANGHRILVYHLVLKEDRKLFEDHIRFLKDNFVVTSVSEVLRTATEAKDKNGYCAAITIDDGFRILMLDCLEILNKHDIKATFFVPTGFVELSNRPDLAANYSLRTHYYNLPMEPMSPEDLQLLVKLGHDVGSHGVSHISISAMSMQQVLRELKVSKERIVEWTGTTLNAFAYPYGHTSNVLGNPRDWLSQAGYSYGFTLKRGSVCASSDTFFLPRDHIEGNWPVHHLRYFLLK